MGVIMDSTVWMMVVVMICGSGIAYNADGCASLFVYAVVVMMTVK